jgi:hypothetical protein
MAAKVATKAKRRDSATKARRELHWLPIRQRCIYKLLVIAYKSLNGMAPKYLEDKLVKKTYSRTTRAKNAEVNNLVVPFNTKKTFADRGFSALVPKHWNNLPIALKTSPSLEIFKKDLKTLLFENSYN